jgi:hypothetical protein
LKLTVLLFTCVLACGAAQLTLPSKSFDRTGVVTATYRTNSLATGRGELSVRWTDALGRLVEERTIAVTLHDEDEIAFALDMSRAVAMRNTVRVHFTFEGKNRRGAEDKRDETAQVEFIARPPEREWDDYHIVMWQQRSPRQVAALKSIGIDGGESVARGESIPEFLLNTICGGMRRTSLPISIPNITGTFPIVRITGSFRRLGRPSRRTGRVRRR